MSKVTVSVAARLTGKSRETINNACNDGTLSSSKNEQGIKVIDVAELERVYPLRKTMDEVKQSEPVNESQGLTEGASDLRAQVAVLKAQLQGASTERDLMKSERERERYQLEKQIEALQASLAKAQEQGNRAMMLLTDQSEGGKNRLHEQEQFVRLLTEKVERLGQQNKRIYRELQEQKKRSFWKWLTGGGAGPDTGRAQERPVQGQAART